MKITHAGITLDIPPPQFGNEHDIQIRDLQGKLHDALRPRKTPLANQERKVKDIMLSLQGVLQMRANQK